MFGSKRVEALTQKIIHEKKNIVYSQHHRKVLLLHIWSLVNDGLQMLAFISSNRLSINLRLEWLSDWSITLKPSHHKRSIQVTEKNQYEMGWPFSMLEPHLTTNGSLNILQQFWKNHF